MRFAEARGEARAQDLEFAMLPREAELDAVPVDTGRPVTFASGDGRDAEIPDVPRHLGELVMREHRDMAEHVVKAVGRFEIVELIARADEIADRETPARTALRRRCRPVPAPARPRFASPVRGSRIAFRSLDVGNARMRQPQQVDAVEEGGDDARAEKLDLPREQQVPDRMVLVVNDSQHWGTT